jgi:dihydroorotate dehydrogenase
VLDLAYKLTRPLLFAMDPEDAHERVLALGGSFPGMLGALGSAKPDPSLATEVAGLSFPSPVGLAAGLDKNGDAILLWEKFGFGFMELGTVTPRPQPGNERPRVHRLVEDQGIVNWMGFPSEGAEAIFQRLSTLRDKGRWPSIPVGFNLGKNKDTPQEDAPLDYALAAGRLATVADFFVINVSSPNTPGLRELQDADALAAILGAVLQHARDRPVWVKLSPDLHEDAIHEAVRRVIGEGAGGIVATNTTVSRPTEASQEFEQGGLSGEPLFPIAHRKVEAVLAAAGEVPVIGVGGINSPERARAMMNSGCKAVEVFTGIIFSGPGLVARLNRGLASEA